MEVEHLYAVLEASGLGSFTAAMAAADKATAAERDQLDRLAAIASIAEGALQGVRISSTQQAQTTSALASMDRSLSAVTATGITAADTLEQVKVGPAQAAETATAAASMVGSLRSVEAQAADLRRSLEGLDVVSGLSAGGRGVAAARLATSGVAGPAGAGGAMGQGLTDAAVAAAATNFLRSGNWVLPTAQGMAGMGAEANMILSSDQTRSAGGGGGGGLGLAAMAAMGGWGGGGRFRVPFTGVGFGGMAAFGSLLGLAGFGMEHAITSGVGVLGSMGGGLLGGGLLGMGAVGTMATGMGTDLAGIGQAAGDIKTVTGDLTKLQDAIEKYGVASQQAAQAQAQVNVDLQGFSQVARGAVLQAAQTSQGFKAMFDRLTGQAEKTGAEIITQAMQVGEHFLPTIGRFAAQNMGIIQQQLQPLFAWLQKPGFTGPGMGGGLGIFTNLEQIFQRNLPSSVQAGSKALEFFIRTVDVAAQQTGHFMQTLDRFFTRMNQPGNFQHWAGTVNNLIGLFRTWLGLFGALVGAIAAVFQPAVGFGQAFAATLTQILDQIKTWLSLSSTQSTLHGLFSVHLVQVVQGLGGILMALLPIVEAVTTAFMRMETIVSGIFATALMQIAHVITLITQIPFAPQIIGWGAALTVVYKANQLLFAGLGRLLGLLPAEVSEQQALTTAMNESTAAADRLAAALSGVGTAAGTAAAATSAAAGEAAAAAVTWERAAGGAMVASVSRVAPAVAAGGVGGLLGGMGSRLGRGSMFAIGGLLAGSTVSTYLHGQTGSALSRALELGGVGAGIGTMIEPGIGTAIGGGLGALAGAVSSFIHIAPSFTQQLQNMEKVVSGTSTRSAQAQLAEAQASRRVAEQAVRTAQTQVKATEGTSRHAQAVYSLTIAQQNLQAQTQTLTSAEQAHTAAVQKQTADIASMTAGLDKLAQGAQTDWGVIGGSALSAGAKLGLYEGRMQQLADSLRSTSPVMAQVVQNLLAIARAVGQIPSEKTISIIVQETIKGTFAGVKSGPGGDLFPTGPRGVSGGLGGPGATAAAHHRHPNLYGGVALGAKTSIFELPTALNTEIAKANYSGSKAQITNANANAAAWVKAMLAHHRFTGQAVADAYSQLAMLKGTGSVHVPGVPNVSTGGAGGATSLLPTGLQAAIYNAQTRVALTGAGTASGSYTSKQLAALKQLEQAQKQALAWLDRQHATGQKLLQLDQARAQVAQQLASTERQISQAQGGAGGGYITATGGFQVPLSMQLAQAKADALAASIQGRGLTAQQKRLAEQVRNAALKAIHSHKLTMQGLIGAWQEVGTINSQLASSAGMIDTYHTVGVSVLTRGLGLAGGTLKTVQEKLAATLAHRGYLANGPAVLGEPIRVPGKQAEASKQHPLNRQLPGGLRQGPRGDIIIEGDLILPNVHNASELRRELEAAARNRHARRGVRR